MYIAVDIGGSKILVAAGTAEGEIVRQQKVETPETADQGVAEIIHLIEQVAGTDAIKGIFVGAPGPLDIKKGRLFDHPAPNLKWGPTDIVTQLKNHFKIPVRLDNDANVAAYAEAITGAGKGQKYVLYVTVSTGIGTGMIMDGEIYHGAHDIEGGHQYIAAEGHSEKFEKAAAGPAMKRRFGQYGYEIADSHTWDAYAKDLATGLHNLAVILSPGIIVIGGGVGVHFHQFYDALKIHLKELQSPYPMPPIVPAMHAETAVVHGALMLAAKLKK